MTSKTKSAFADKKMIGRAIKESFIKLNPKTQVQNPVMLLVYFCNSNNCIMDCFFIWIKRCI